MIAPRMAEGEPSWALGGVWGIPFYPLHPDLDPAGQGVENIHNMAHDLGKKP